MQQVADAAKRNADVEHDGRTGTYALSDYLRSDKTTL